jgi:hypothetical protein
MGYPPGDGKQRSGLGRLIKKFQIWSLTSVIVRGNGTRTMIHPLRAKWLSAEMLCVTRFTGAGYGVSLPITAQPYDFVVDDGVKLLRMQVKIASVTEREKSKTSGHAERAHFMVVLRGKERRGKHVFRPRSVIGNFDFLCVVCTPDRIYVIPAKTLESEKFPGHLLNFVHIKTEDDMPDRKDAREAVARWKPFLNNFKL